MIKFFMLAQFEKDNKIFSNGGRVLNITVLEKKDLMEREINL